MKSKDFISKIGLKLIVAVGIITIVIISAFSYFSIQAQSDVLLSQAEIQANKLSETIKNSTHSSMLQNKREEIHTIINAISQETSIREIRVLNKEGRIMFSSQNDLIGKMVDKQAESCYACHTADKPLERLPINERVRVYKIHPDSSRILGVINPIYNDKSCWNADCHAHPKEQKVLGVLDVKMDLTDVDRQISNSEFRFIIFAIIAIVALSFIIGFFVRKWIGKPVKELVTATNQVSTGNLNYTIKSLGKDELGILAMSFNNMTKKLAEARMQLFQSDKMASLGRLAAGVAHEINNPLTGVLTYSSFLLKRTKGNPEVQEDLQVIVRETKRSREIVKSLLDFARQSVPKKQHADINEIIEQAISVINNQLSLKQIKLEKNLESNLPQVTVDTNQVQQVFINLIVNASDAIGKDGGTIKISSSSISLSSFGTSQIKRAICPKRHDLMDNEIKIDGLPTVKVKINSNGEEGLMNLDPVYGKHRHHFGIEIKKGKSVQVSCPKCNTSLISDDKKCPKCNSTIFSFEIPSQGMFEACTNSDCGWEKWAEEDDAGKKEFVEVKISDNGCGIEKEDLAKIFEPFYSTKGQSGTGLGLAVIWGIIDNHNGTINVDSEIGRGTTFKIRLPI
ncbi:HAMP domain-containing protein [bacterium BMS3Abin03]|nr:HAMP domain-containing protein [bacterium BMS3Abin03]MCG6961421.1 HAMP domain-containing protein [bacterium BMS3Abin03]